MSATITEPTYYTLAALLDGPLHGYAIARKAHELSAGRVRLSAGTLYGALTRLTERGLVAIDHQEIVDGRNRRYHRLTDAGRQTLKLEAGRMVEAAAIVMRHHARPAGGTA